MHIEVTTRPEADDLAAVNDGMRRCEVFGVLEDRPIGTRLYHMKTRPVPGP